LIEKERVKGGEERRRDEKKDDLYSLCLDIL